MQVIYKYAVTPSGLTTEIPEGAKILHVAAVGMGVFLWALVNPAAPLVHRQLAVLPTGRMVDTNGIDTDMYLGTVHLPDGMIFHLFDLGEGPQRKW